MPSSQFGLAKCLVVGFDLDGVFVSVGQYSLKPVNGLGKDDEVICDRRTLLSNAQQMSPGSYACHRFNHLSQTT